MSFLAEKLCFLLLCMLLTALNSIDTITEMNVLLCRTLMSLKHCFSVLAGFKRTSMMCGTSQKPQLQGRTIPLHTVRSHSLITDHDTSHIVVCVSCSYDALRGSCCYFEETPVRLTTGCQSLLSVIFSPLFGLCDWSPAGGERSRLHSLL